AGRGDTRRPVCGRRRRRLLRDEQVLVDRRQASQLPVRNPGRMRDQAGETGKDAARRDLHRGDAGLLGLARRGRRPGDLGALRPDQLRQGPAGPARARQSRRRPRALGLRAGEAADAAPEDPDLATLAEASQLPEIEGNDDETAALGPAEQAQLAAAAIEAAGDMPVYGFFTSGTATVAVVTSAGFAGEQTSTDTMALALAATDRVSGYAEQTAWAVRVMDPAAVARQAVELAGRTSNADELAPGSYRAVLGPYAVGEILQYFAFDAFSGLA